MNKKRKKESPRKSKNQSDELSEAPNEELERFLRHKKVRKVRRTVIQIIVLVFIAFWISSSIFFPPVYEAYEAESLDTGKAETSFIAISYFGVEKYNSDSTTLIEQERLEEHIQALKRCKYVTITQQDIVDYYQKGKRLPERALFLMFEDGRTDTAIFSEPILKKNNYKATIFNYADKFEMKDNKFLSAEDMLTLMAGTFWELGTNGYRLEYINVFDRYGNFFGHLNSNEFVFLNQYIVRDYNHYLMDYFRDEDGLREESFAEMQARIGADYNSMRYIYLDNLGFVPKLYTLMHSNTGQFGTNDEASSVNGEYITQMFTMNYNREGSCLNTTESSIYDLTRMQPQENWYPNHLLMRIADDTGDEMQFVLNDRKESLKWTKLAGAFEFRGDTIALTSEPGSYGRMFLKEADYNDLHLSVTLNGNKAGNQGIYLRTDENLQSGIYVGIENNLLNIRSLPAGTELYTLDLFEFDGGSKQSVEENEQEGLEMLVKALTSYDDNYERLQEALELDKELKTVPVETLKEGGEGYVPDIDLNDHGSRALELFLSGESLTVSIDGKTVIKNLPVPAGENSKIGLESSALIQAKYSQRNLNDDVYDAVYTDLRLTSLDGKTEYYSYTLTGLAKAWEVCKTGFEKVASFFVDTF